MIESTGGRPAEAAHAEGVSISLSTVAWVAVGLAFVLLRVGPTWRAPVAGPELLHLAGAWQASEGVGDARFVPTLFQALASVLLRLSTSEVPARVLALLATATIPGALYVLRSQLGNAGALFALCFLALDGPGIALGTSASVMGFDLAMAAWLFVALSRPALPPLTWGVAAFWLATAGPVPLPLVVAAAGVAILRKERVRRPVLYAAGAGVVVGVAATSLRFGVGWDGLRVVPFRLLAAGFDEEWSTPTTARVMGLYGLPLLLAGLVAAGYAVAGLVRRHDTDGVTQVLVAWAGVALMWVVVSASSSNPVPIAALALPLALLLGPAAARALGAMADADWRLARFILPGSALAVAVAFYVMLSWARVKEVGDRGEVAAVSGLLIMAAAALVYLALDRRSAPTLAAAALGLAALPIVAGAFGVVLSAVEEPLLSPVLAPQAEQLRATALEGAAHRGGVIVVHPGLRDDVTWALRDVDYEVAGTVPADAAVAIWPADLPRPQGMAPLDVTWALRQTTNPPAGGFLEYLHWFTNRNTLVVKPEPVAVYLAAKQ